MQSSDSSGIYGEVPLSSNQETRLLQLHPHNGDWDSPVTCTLLKTTLSDAPSYEALSYCWGDKTASHQISINSVPFHVTANLASGLRHLRRTEIPKLLWVDAICINQRDTAERSAQVSLMHEIYQKAVRTVIWLGEANEDGELALEFLQWYAGRKALYEPSDINGHHQDYETSGWIAVRNLMKRPYWRRLWVMQEIALSTAQPRVFCGRKAIPWGTLCSALESEQSAHFMRRLHRVRGATLRLVNKETLQSDVKSGTHIIMLLSYSSGFETTEPRDRVYALYGLFRVSRIVDFQPDYSKSVAEVYQQITAFVLQMKCGLDVLELRAHDQEAGLPSWVIDLSRQAPLSLPRLKQRPWWRGFDKREQRGEKMEIRFDDTILKVSGAVVDEVATVAPVPKCVSTALKRAAEDADAHRFGGESLRSNDVAALGYWKELEDPDHRESLCRNLFEYLFSFHEVVSYFCQDEKDALAWFPRAWDWKQMLNEAPTCDADSDAMVLGFEKKYAEHLKHTLCTLSLMLHGRSCFKTKMGFLGAGPAGIQVGDRLVAFQSTKQLHVLRPQSDYHVYVGASFLVAPANKGHGAEQEVTALFTSVRDGVTDDQRFHLR